eukprot:TRINITY_DN5436_c0_g1_i3.p2 TRINITY_DN5436_c0_g1~~TRINITY_DN5436_c0_g1_i3.p2  ORF type:complete len:161 (+),score=25.75 TRINITY_DN5436_c0_g1_i3:97-579(+)
MVEEKMNPKVQLKSADDQIFSVDVEVANMSEMLRNMIEDVEDAQHQVIPLLNVGGKILAKVIEYCAFHVDSEKKDENDKQVMSEEHIKNWDKEFVRVDQSTLFELILAANYLNISKLLDLTCETVATMIKGKTPEEIRETFGIKNDFTPEEEEEVRKENQ